MPPQYLIPGLHRRTDATFPRFADVALGSMHPRHSAAWADFNLDGCLDLFVGNESGVAMTWSSHSSELYLGNCRGTFTEVSHKVGIDVDAFVKGVAWGDVDNDGWEDLLVLSYDNRVPLHEAVGREYLGLPVAKVTGASASGPATSALEHTHLHRNKGDGTFEDVSEKVGLADKAIYAMGSNFGDLDNDGWLDVYLGTGNPDLRSVIPNRMFRNEARPHSGLADRTPTEFAMSLQASTPSHLTLTGLL